MSDRICARPDCGAELVKKPGVGRWPKYCPGCRPRKVRPPGYGVKDWTVRECLHCGEVIPARADNRHQRYCSRACSRAAYEANVRSSPERVAARLEKERARRAQLDPTPKKELLCDACGGAFQSHQNARFCSKACARNANLLDGKWCSQEGCSSPIQARGLCITHYNNLVSTTRYKVVDIPCTHCGTVVRKVKRAGRNQFCSYACRDAFQHRDARLAEAERAERRARDAVALVPLGVGCAIPASHPARRPAASRPRLFIAGRCAWCREPFVMESQTQVRYCSSKCARYAGRHRRGLFVIPRRVRLEIYTRDNWACQLCFTAVDPDLHPSDPWAATLDHIECQSWALVPDHSPSNLRLAHRWCNSARGDETYYSAADLVAAP